MKRFAVWVVAGLMILSLTACGNPEPATSGEPSTEVSAEVSPEVSAKVSATVSSEVSPGESAPVKHSAAPETEPDAEGAALDAALAASFALGYLAQSEDGSTECLIAATEDGQKAVVVVNKGQETDILFGDVQQNEEGVLTVTDDVTGAVFTAICVQDEAGQIVVTLEDGTQMAASAADAAAVTSTLEKLDS